MSSTFEPIGFRSEPGIVDRHSHRGLYFEFDIFFEFSRRNTNCVYIETKKQNSERTKLEVRRTASQVCFVGKIVNKTSNYKHIFQLNVNINFS